MNSNDLISNKVAGDRKLCIETTNWVTNINCLDTRDYNSNPPRAKEAKVRIDRKFLFTFNLGSRT